MDWLGRVPMKDAMLEFLPLAPTTESENRLEQIYRRAVGSRGEQQADHAQRCSRDAFNSSEAVNSPLSEPTTDSNASAECWTREPNRHLHPDSSGRG